MTGIEYKARLRAEGHILRCNRGAQGGGMVEWEAKGRQRWGMHEKQPLFVPELEFDPKKTALLVVDMQYGSAHRHYGYGKVLAAEIADYYFTRLETVVVPNQVKLLAFFRQHGLRIIFVASGSLVPDRADLTPHRKQRWKEGKTPARWTGDFEYSLLPELNRREEEPIIAKVSGGAFNSTGIDHILRNMGVEGLVITGVGTSACVETTARDAADRGFKCILLEDACAGLDAESHAATMRVFARIYGYVKTTDEVVQEFAGKLATDDYWPLGEAI